MIYSGAACHVDEFLTKLTKDTKTTKNFFETTYHILLVTFVSLVVFCAYSCHPLSGTTGWCDLADA